MKCVILAGGRGTRLSELTDKLPKPMVKIVGKPIIVHIINHFRKYGIREFIIASIIIILLYALGLFLPIIITSN